MTYLLTYLLKKQNLEMLSHLKRYFLGVGDYNLQDEELDYKDATASKDDLSSLTTNVHHLLMSIEFCVVLSIPSFVKLERSVHQFCYTPILFHSLERFLKHTWINCAVEFWCENLEIRETNFAQLICA